MSDTTTTVVDTVDTYFDIWNEPDPGRRAQLIERAWAPDGHYVDPLLDAAGHDGLNAMVAGVRRQFPGHRLRRQSGVDAHHGLVRFAWDLAGADGTVAVAGIDVGVVGADGRLQRIAGFFGDPPPLAG